MGSFVGEQFVRVRFNLQTAAFKAAYKDALRKASPEISLFLPQFCPILERELLQGEYHGIY